MSRLLSILCAVVLTAEFAFRAGAEAAPSVPAELGRAGAELVDAGGTVVLTVPLTRPVPWRVTSRPISRMNPSLHAVVVCH